MKAATLLLLRLTTGLLLTIWGAIKLTAPNMSIAVSDRYYSSVLSGEAMQTPLGASQILLGVLVILGVFRAVVYPVQALVLGLSVVAIWKYIADPLGLYLLTEQTRQVLFFPSSTVFAASLVLLAFKADDRLSLGALLKR
ncbi:MAG: hypothetical protein AAGJ87_00620 [Pseudomonadota bacterium]